MKNSAQKRVISIFVIMALFAAFFVPSHGTQAQESISEIYSETESGSGNDTQLLSVGDVNRDGRLNASDARLLLRCASQLDETTAYILSVGDYDGDKKITASDARIALRVAAGIDSIKCLQNGHSFVSVSYSPTCTKEGYTTNKCRHCAATDGSRTDVIPATGHKTQDKITKPTCTAAGHITSKCTVCGFVTVDRDDGKALGHSFSDWVMSKTEKTRKCVRCSYSETVKIEKKNEKVIYLTFDDGPGPYTEKLLRYLREYDVKATFFVTNQNPRYIHLLKTMAADGHAIGVHTLTHNWNIYSSEAKYMQDFNAMHKIIKEQTGIDTKIFRFPGGTNNTVSRSYSRGIMTKLAKSMTAKGYYYFDWNVDCYDTSGYNSSQIARTTINQISSRKVSIVLMHDIKNSTVESVKRIIEYGLANGYTFEVLDETSPAIRFNPAN